MNKCAKCIYMESNTCRRSPPTIWEDQAVPQRGAYPRVSPELDGCGEWVENKVVQYETKVPEKAEAKKPGRPWGRPKGS